MPRRSRAESEATARDVLDAAARLFTTRGYAAVGLEEVAATAGVTRGAVYHHYRSKETLFVAVLAAAQDEIGDAVVAAADREPEPWAALEAGCRAFLVHSLDDDCRRVVLVDAPAVLGWQTWRAHDAEGSASHLREALQGLVDAGVVRVGSVAATTALVSGAMNEAVLWIAAQANPDAALVEAWNDLQQLLSALRREPDGAADPPA